MLRFILVKEQELNAFPEFQYIPCYGLSRNDHGCDRCGSISIHPMLRFIPDSIWTEWKQLEFQYIPCYGLSRCSCCRCRCFFKFQYIPCYGLSAFLNPSRVFCTNFNTSHVTVYLRTGADLLDEIYNFNTSHVTVYRRLNRFTTK